MAIKIEKQSKVTITKEQIELILMYFLTHDLTNETNFTINKSMTWKQIAIACKFSSNYKEKIIEYINDQYSIEIEDYKAHELIIDNQEIKIFIDKIYIRLQWMI